jgi:cold shock CspA family protein
MALEFGYIKIEKYNTERGFGFVQNTFSQSNQETYFHISTIKKVSFKLARQLDHNEIEKVGFWFHTEETERGINVSKIWFNLSNIPKKEIEETKALLEELWLDGSFIGSQTFYEKTCELLGESRAIELKTNHENIVAQQKAQELLEKKLDPSLPRQRTTDPENIKEVYLGIPSHLNILRVKRQYRTNPLSFIEGGSDLVVEYYDGRGFLYDWIKCPSAYIASFFGSLVNYDNDHFKILNKDEQLRITKEKIARIFARSYEKEEDADQTPFRVVWNAKTSNELPWKSLKKFEDDYKNQKIYEPEEDYFESEIDFSQPYFIDEIDQYESPIDKAERIYGIPDPRLLEFF